MFTTSRNRFAKGSGVFKCQSCGHNTRDTGGDNTGVRSCYLCYDLAGEENHLSDHRKLYGSTDSVRAMLTALDKQSGTGTAQREFPEVYAAAWAKEPA